MMQHKYCFEAVQRMLADACSDDPSLFDDRPTLFGGNLAQILPCGIARLHGRYCQRMPASVIPVGCNRRSTC